MAGPNRQSRRAILELANKSLTLPSNCRQAVETEILAKEQWQVLGHFGRKLDDRRWVDAAQPDAIRVLPIGIAKENGASISGNSDRSAVQKRDYGSGFQREGMRSMLNKLNITSYRSVDKRQPMIQEKVNS